jgi:uncharacterized protein YndB with AHSA1/START domain
MTAAAIYHCATWRLRMPTATDRIEKTSILRAPRSRVWRAITNAEEFGEWFRAKLSGAFVEGATVRGKITYPGYEHLTLEVQIVRIEPERYFAFRWHPHAVDLTRDYSGEPTTLVEFTLEEVPEGTRLTIVESGFDKVPPGTRDEAFRENDKGWTEQMANVAAHVARA